MNESFDSSATSPQNLLFTVVPVAHLHVRQDLVSVGALRQVGRRQKVPLDLATFQNILDERDVVDRRRQTVSCFIGGPRIRLWLYL